VKHERTFAELLSRCLRSRCPVCGKGRLFASLFGVGRFRNIFIPLEACEHCQFRFSREPGYYFGCFTPILQILSVWCGAIVAAVSYFVFHADVESVVVAALFGIMGGFLLFFRTSIAMFIAIDHAINPPDSDFH